MKKEIFRMCVSCRNKKPKNELIRFVKTSNDDVKIDNKYQIDGRSAYICNCQDCINKCIKQKLINKSFKQNVNKEIYLQLEEEFLARK